MQNVQDHIRTILIVSPHPDDELIGAGATVLQLVRAGYRVVNLACSLGRPEQYARRRVELENACRLAGIELVIPDKPALISSTDDLEKAQQELAKLITEMYQTYQPLAVIAPSVHDGHHGHEVVARATRNSLAEVRGARLWMWNIWGELPYPTLYSPFDDDTLHAVMLAVDAYKGENDRNDYRQMALGRALLGSVLGSEKIFGYGSPAASTQRYAELFTEVVHQNGHWLEGQHRMLNFDNPFAPPSNVILDTWMNSPSPRQLYRDMFSDIR